MENNKLYIYGRNTVIEAINSGADLEKIYISFVAKGGVIDKIKGIARKRKIPVATMDKHKFIELERSIADPQDNTQGVIALRTAFENVSLEDMIKKLSIIDNPVVVVLDNINDTHNLGAIVRSAECSGADAVIRPERNSAPVTPAAIKTAAGAFEHIPVVTVGNLNQSLEKLKDNGYWIIGTSMTAKQDYYQMNLYDRPLAIIIGNEGGGMRKSVEKHCDGLIKIPMKGKTESLNASVSAGIILFDILRQKKLNA